MPLPTNPALLTILDAIDRTPDLQKSYVLKGGNALKIVYRGPRASVEPTTLLFDPYPSIPKKSPPLPHLRCLSSTVYHPVNSAI